MEANGRTLLRVLLLGGCPFDLGRTFHLIVAPFVVFQAEGKSYATLVQGVPGPVIGSRSGWEPKGPTQSLLELAIIYPGVSP